MDAGDVKAVLDRDINYAKSTVAGWKQRALASYVYVRDKVHKDDIGKIEESFSRFDSSFGELDRRLAQLYEHDPVLSAELYGLITLMTDSALSLGVVMYMPNFPRAIGPIFNLEEKSEAGLESGKTRRALAQQWHQSVERIASEILAEKPSLPATRLTQSVIRRSQEALPDYSTVYRHLCKWRKGARGS